MIFKSDSQKYPCDWHKYFRDISKLGKFIQFQLTIVFKIQKNFRIMILKSDSQKYPCDWHKYFRDISKLGKFIQFQLTKFKKFRITELNWIFKSII